MTILLQNMTLQDSFVSLITWMLGLFCYLFILTVTAKSSRVLQTLSALIGTGAIITFGMLSVLLLVTPFAGGRLAVLVTLLVLFWSIPVKGHIIARAIERHWYAGFVIALSIFILQYSLSRILTPES